MSVYYNLYDDFQNVNISIIIFQKIGQIAHNVPVVYDVPTLNASEGWTCALGWRFDSMFLLPLPCPPTGGNANQKARSDSDRAGPRAQSACSVYNPVRRSAGVFYIFLYILFQLCNIF
jgi:hypothetical protein